MRVIAGEARGRRLTAPPGTDTRPTSDSVREAVFGAVLSRIELEGIRALDLFAGSGALGIEALSRGAAEVTFVDSAPRAVAAVKANLAATGLDGGRVVSASVSTWLATLASSELWSLVFADPPYAFDGWTELLTHLQPHVTSDGLFVAESDRELTPAGGWRVVRLKKYGATVVTMLALDEEAPPGQDAV